MSNAQAPNVRLTPDRLAEIRRWVAEDYSEHSTYAALLAELDAVTRERDGARRVSEYRIAMRTPSDADHLRDVADELESMIENESTGYHRHWQDAERLRAFADKLDQQSRTIAGGEDAPAVPLAHTAAPDAPGVGAHE